MESPAGPNAVLTSNFKQIGRLTIDLSKLSRSDWELEEFTIPLEGSVEMKIQCNAQGGVEERGFLTMFDDVSGYGAWIRRWCQLNGNQLNYWTYPEDQIQNKVNFCYSNLFN